MRAWTSTARPFSNVTTRSSTSTPTPGITSGRVVRITPSARRRSGLVKTSSVGRFGRYVTPAGVVSPPPTHTAPSGRPAVRSVPSPWYRTASSSSAVSVAPWRPSRSACARHAATTSSLSSRMAIDTASQSRSTSGSPNTCSAHPAFGAATMFHTTDPPSIAWRDSRASSRGISTARAGSTSSNTCGSAVPVSRINAAPSRLHERTCSSSQSNDVVSASSGPCSSAARRTRGSS